MSAITDRAKAVLDALKGSTFTGARAVEIARGFINDDQQTNDVTAQLFLNMLTATVKSTVKSNAQQAAATFNDVAEVQVGDDAVADL